MEPPTGAAAGGLTTAPPFPLEAAGLGQTRDGLRLELHANSMDSHKIDRTPNKPYRNTHVVWRELGTEIRQSGD